jgi:Zn-dependent hydrolases, including glyoxylases
MEKNLKDRQEAEAAGKDTSKFMPTPPIPTSHTEITDGQKFTLGDTTITIVSTPGHTPGGVSLIIPVTDNGTKHMVSLWGGTGLPKSLEDNKAYLNSLYYFAKFTDAAQVDAQITAHSAVDNSAERMETLRKRKAGDPNPFVIGQEAYKAYMNKMKTNVTANIEKLSKK